MSESDGGASQPEPADETAVVSDRGMASASQPTGDPRGAAVGWPTSSGRYAMLEQVGAGGMGEVYRAYDPKLRREVALKRVRFGRSGSTTDTEAEARLLREAQAMAQLSHPNVVPVYDVDQTDDGVVLAMEFVEGQTLKAWLRQRDRTVREILEVFIAAGRGLAAAHAAGIIHRDFKPTNVLIGEDGRARVLDFGLARAVDVLSADAAAASPDDGASSDSLTQAGTVMGTPPYMAPEQHIGATVDARTDQYAFCVALWEALFGERPFGGSPAELLAAKRAGPPAPPPKLSRPSWIVRATSRGLQADPAGRWPDMTALLDVLSRDPTGRRRRIAIGAVGLAAVAVAGWQLRASPEDPCEVAARAFDDTWHDDARASIHAAFTASGLGFAEASWTRVETGLDEYATAWIDARVDACRSTREGGESASLADRRLACLDRRERTFRERVAVLRDLDAETLENALRAVDTLPPLGPCSDREALLAEVEPPDDPELAATVAAIRTEIARGDALNATGQMPAAAELFATLRERTESIDYAPVRAEVLMASCYPALTAVKLDDVEAWASEAYYTAFEMGYDVLAAEAISMLYDRAERAADAAGVERWQRPALAYALRVDPGGMREADVRMRMSDTQRRALDFDAARENLTRAIEIRRRLVGYPEVLVATAVANLGALEREAGNFAESLQLQQQGLDEIIAAEGPDHPLVAHTHQGMGNSLIANGEYAKAIAHFDAAIAVLTRAYGEDFVEVGSMLVGKGMAQWMSGDAAAAVPTLTRSAEMMESGYGPEHPALASALTNLGNALADLDRGAEAIEKYERALAIRTKALGPDHPTTAGSLANLGVAYTAQGDHARAIEMYDRALANWEKNLGPDHYDVATVVRYKAEAHLAAREYEPAVPLLRRSLKADIANYGEDHPMTVYSRRGLGHALVGLGRMQEAIPIVRQVLAMEHPGGADPRDLASSQFDLARALGDTDEARDLAAQARRALADNEGDPQRIAEIDAWIADHGGA